MERTALQKSILSTSNFVQSEQDSFDLGPQIRKRRRIMSGKNWMIINSILKSSLPFSELALFCNHHDTGSF